ncbi:MAG: Gfo/Idh/MocA family oxidoreductase [Oscillatoriales cyanobacterium C42_A2020_001]|nr:Gfo/Idh/MocA family oxidoreductase [Leptolyngbyaceae cyanobacterium C42_A2020_001]
MPNTIRWGILGTGYIAGEFAKGLQFVPNTQLVAVGSRSLGSAQAFARQFNVPQAFGSYEEVVQSDVDVVYIATPAGRHRDDCILCLNANKAVLCEKPFTVNAREAQEVIELARSKQLFCMEAMWMRFMPLIQQVKQAIAQGAIGDVSMFTADFSVPTEFNAKNRYYDPELGGGVLLDRGIYALSLAFQLLGKPSQIVSQATVGKTGVDEQAAMILSYPTGQLAILSASFRTYSPNEALIMGDRGRIRIHEPFYRPHKLSTVTKFPLVTSSKAQSSSGLKQKLTAAIKQNSLVQRLYYQLEPMLKSAKSNLHLLDGNGYNYEAAEVVRCLQAGELESKIMPLDETLQIMQAMDTMRQRWGVKYPQD